MHTIDITHQKCPMTLVKVKLKLSKLAEGESLQVILKAGEPLNSVPKSLLEQGYPVSEPEKVAEDVYRFVVTQNPNGRSES